MNHDFMKSNKQNKRTTYLLTNHQGVEIHLSVPCKESSEQKYYLEYNSNGRKKYYGKGEVKRKASQFFNSLNGNEKLKHAQLEALLSDVFMQDIELIIYDMHTASKFRTISMRTTISNAIMSFYEHKGLQQQEGTIEERALGNYGQYHRKLLQYFDLQEFRNMCLIDLSADFWIKYRIDLINNNYNMNTKVLGNATINQHMQYVTQFYGWLIDYLELPIKNHSKKLTKLNEAKQIKRFKVLESSLLSDFYHILEEEEKDNFTSLYLSALLTYENNIRLSEQVLIKLAHVNFENGTIDILNKKNDSLRTVKMSLKAKELLNIIKSNTISKGIVLDNDLYIFGGYNRFKSGKPVTYKELGTLMRRFRKKYPQFAGRTLYEQKHTSITQQFNSGIEPYQIKQRANHSSISTTEIYLQSSQVIKPFEFQDTSK